MSAAVAAPQLALVSRGTERWLSAEEAMTRTGWSAFWLREQVKRGRVTSRDSQTIAPNGRPLREYLESSLPDTPSAAPQTQLTVVGPPPSALGPLFSGLSAASERIVLSDSKAQLQAEQRLAIIQPLLDYSANAERFTQLRLADGRSVTSLERMIEYAAGTAGQSTRTIKRWIAAYRTIGFAGLADRIRIDKGQSRWFSRNYNASILAAYLYLNERQSVSFVHEQLGYEAETLGLDINDLPSRETVRVFLSQSISPAMKALAREGQREYRLRMAPYVRRGYVDVFANQIWVGDHAIHDVEISNDLFEEVPFGTPGRLRMSAFVDYRSRKAWATWAWEGSSRSIAATVVRAMLEDGPPEGIYVDNGKDYKKVAKGAIKASDLPESKDDDTKAPEKWWERECEAIEKTGLLARLGISVTHCIPRHPQSKHVERFFRTMHMHFDARHSTYTSGSPFTRPEATENAMMRHRWLLKAGRVAESNHPLASRFILGCLTWLDEYNNTPQHGEGMDGCTPNQIFDAERNPNQKSVPERSAIALLLLDYVVRKVRECAITLNKYRYTPRPEDRLAWAAMHEANECDVRVGFNSGDPEYVVVTDMDGRFLAWLEAEPLLRFAPNDKITQAQIGESMSIRRGLEKATKASLSAIAVEARRNGARTAEESLYSRLLIPTTTGDIITQRKPRVESTSEPENQLVPGEAADRLAARLRRK